MASTTANQGTRFVIGIDLGTTNCALAYVDGSRLPERASASELPEVQVLALPQLVQPGVVDERLTLPSFLYLPGEHELPPASLGLPWVPEQPFAVGEFARQQGALVPGRLVSSAKSWLCHGGVDRRAPLLPFEAVDGVEKVSPVEAAAFYLDHLKQAWNAAVGRAAGERFEEQEILLAVPASFDAVARELTVDAARQAGIQHLTLLEEPQAAFYSWIALAGEGWRKQLAVGDLVLVCDIGGGTTDFTLIAVAEEEGELALRRIAVGDHILLGGDNMDLALAFSLQQRLAAEGARLDSWQMRGLTHSCRAAKEALLADPALAEQPIVILGRGARVIGGTLRSQLGRQDLEALLLDGFFPDCEPSERPRRQRQVGLRELGLPFAAEAAVTRHLARFLGQQAGAVGGKGSSAGGSGGGSGSGGRAGSNGGTGGAASGFVSPTAILVNGGVFKGPLIAERLYQVLARWVTEGGGQAPKMLLGTDLDLAVARGAAYYGLVRRGRGVRIRGGTARSYYVGIETSMPAVPGMPAPLKALCVAAFGMEEGTEVELPGREFGLVVGEPAEFRFLSSTSRRGDRVGTLVEEWQDEEIEELAPLESSLPSEQPEGTVVPVSLRSAVTEVGTLELWCVAREGGGRFRLELNLRQQASEEPGH